MNIFLISPQPWTLPAAERHARHHRLSFLQGRLGQLHTQLVAARPDLVILRDFEQSPALFEQIDALCASLPATALVLLCPDPAPAFLMGVMRAGVREVMPNDDEATISGLIARIQGRQGGREGRPHKGRCIGVIPAKGGDGASCLVANLAASVAAQPGARVLLMDLSLPFGDVELFLTRESITHDLTEVSEEIERLDGALLDGLTQHLTPGLHFIGAPPSLEKYLQLKPDHVLRLIRLALRHYDQVFLDLGLDAIGLSVLEMLDQLVIAGTFSLPSVKGASHLVALWEQLGHAPDKLCLAMRRADARTDIQPADVEAAVGLPLARLVPQDQDGVAQSLLQGRAAVELKPRSELARFHAAWATELTGKAQAPTVSEKSLWHRLRIR